MHAIAAKAVGFKEAMGEVFQEDQKHVVRNAKVLADSLMSRGFRLVSGGTDNHLMLLDLTSKDISGKEAESLLGMAGITVNKNAIPFDTQSRYVTSGVRIGTPLVTTRGMRAQEMEAIAGFIDLVVEKRDEKTLQKVRAEIMDLCRRFPLSNIVARIR